MYIGVMLDTAYLTLLNHTTLDSDKNVKVRGIFNNGYFC